MIEWRIQLNVHNREGHSRSAHRAGLVMFGLSHHRASIMMDGKEEEEEEEEGRDRMPVPIGYQYDREITRMQRGS